MKFDCKQANSKLPIHHTDNAGSVQTAKNGRRIVLGTFQALPPVLLHTLRVPLQLGSFSTMVWTVLSRFPAPFAALAVLSA